MIDSAAWRWSLGGVAREGLLWRCALCDTMALTSVCRSPLPLRSDDLLLRRAPFPDISAVKLSAPGPGADLMRKGKKNKKKTTTHHLLGKCFKQRAITHHTRPSQVRSGGGCTGGRVGLSDWWFYLTRGLLVPWWRQITAMLPPPLITNSRHL